MSDETQKELNAYKPLKERLQPRRKKGMSSKLILLPIMILMCVKVQIQTQRKLAKDSGE
jgi:hypothetical protein